MPSTPHVNDSRSRSGSPYEHSQGPRPKPLSRSALAATNGLTYNTTNRSLEVSPPPEYPHDSVKPGNSIPGATLINQY
ncbi:hypothetical protein K457DRAFT_17777 [Linnemannia elongata AG-77]|uniref:Uncharacterized protein n=1 Tax=Linnemannia elongata AG-77 TaxID=1314771 RepID=A0A197K398_9FUNG|nr:hypothetical protein K457DRAFT_17777 [Linnemannia elongata AG-77]